jgi:lipid-binding SYLF domain-containing protein
MRNILTTIQAASFFLALFLGWGTTLADWDPNKARKEQDEVATTIANFKKNDPGLQKFFDKAHAYAVFPNVGKGGLIIGGGYGEGYVFEDGKLIGSAKLTQVSIGAQIGGQGFSELIFFQDQKAFDRFKDGNMKFGAQLSAVAAKAGAAKNTTYADCVAVFAMAKAGLMAEATVGGQTFDFTPKK